MEDEPAHLGLSAWSPFSELLMMHYKVRPRSSACRTNVKLRPIIDLDIAARIAGKSAHFAPLRSHTFTDLRFRRKFKSELGNNMNNGKGERQALASTKYKEDLYLFHKFCYTPVNAN